MPTSEVEGLVINAIRAQSKSDNNGDGQLALNNRDLIERHVQRVTIKPDAIEICGIRPTAAAEQADRQGDRAANQKSNNSESISISVPWTAPSCVAVKGITPSSRPIMMPETRDTLLIAIAKARRWIDDLIEGRAESFAAIAKYESKVERHVRFLAPLAFLSPRITAAILDPSAPHDITVTSLVKALPYSWAEQE